MYWDLFILHYKVGCCCLGLIHKLVTGPLWRKMELEKTALNMTQSYQFMLSCFQNWCEDASCLIKDEGLFPELVKKDEMFFKLTEANRDIDARLKSVSGNYFWVICIYFIKNVKRSSERWCI